MELGGKCPTIVLDDANLEQAVSSLSEATIDRTLKCI